MPMETNYLIGRQLPGVVLETMYIVQRETVSKPRERKTPAPSHAALTPTALSAETRYSIKTVERAVEYLKLNRMVEVSKSGRTPQLRLTPGEHWRQASDYSDFLQKKPPQSESEPRTAKPRHRPRKRIEAGESADIAVRPGVETLRLLNTMGEAIVLTELAESPPGEPAVQCMTVEAATPPEAALEPPKEPVSASPVTPKSPQVTDSKESARQSKTPSPFPAPERKTSSENQPQERAFESSLKPSQMVFAACFGQELDDQMLAQIEHILGNWPPLPFVEMVKDKCLFWRTGKAKGRYTPGILPLLAKDYVKACIAGRGNKR